MNLVMAEGIIPQGSSKYFVIALVTFEDNDDALACDQRITLLRRELNLPPNYEFLHSMNSAKIRNLFSEAVSPYPFFYHAFALNKDPNRLYGPGFDIKESLYKFTTRLAFENDKPYLIDAKVIIDESGDRKFRNELAVYLRKRIGTKPGRNLIRSVKIQRSVGNNLLQLADYVASISNRAICDKADSVKLRRMYLATHEMTMDVWPK